MPAAANGPLGGSFGVAVAPKRMVAGWGITPFDQYLIAAPPPPASLSRIRQARRLYGHTPLGHPVTFERARARSPPPVVMNGQQCLAGLGISREDKE